MNRLRSQFAAVLIAAIVTVVGLASVMAVTLLRPPLPANTIEPVARQIHLQVRLVETAPQTAQTAGVDLRAAPASGEADPETQHILHEALARTGGPLPLRVTRSADAPVAQASIDLGAPGWLIVEIPDFRPPDGPWRILAVWMGLILVGSTAVSLYAASRLTRPLEILHRASDRLGADGLPQPIAETGPGEVRATARALNSLSAQVRSAMESRMRLVAAAGHDLRTPMTRMRLRAEFIPDDDERARWLADLHELETIADSAIRLVREEGTRDSVEVLCLDRVLSEIASDLSAQNLPVTLSPPPAARVSAAPTALTRVLRNLIVNAATHGGGAQVSLRLDGERACVTIVDRGPGIPEDLLDRVFEPFFRVDPARRRTAPGAGLGLAIAREIAGRFNGRITVRNREGGGLEQELCLPLLRD